MRMQEATAARRSNTVPALPPMKVKDRKKLLYSLAEAFKGLQSESFNTLMRVEKMTPEQLRAQPTAGTAFAVLEQELAKQGFTTTGRVGGIMDVVELTQPEVDYFACYCNHGELMVGSRAASNLRHLAENRVTRYVNENTDTFRN